MSVLRKRYLRLGPVRLAHYDVGEGRPLLFVHGIPTSSYLWRKVIGPLRGSFRCLAPDLLGLGDTEGPADADYAMPAQAELLLRFLDAKGIDRVRLVCHDQGGAAAQQLVARAPERVERWVLASVVAFDGWPVPAVRKLQAVARRPTLFHALAALGVGQRLSRGWLGYRRAVVDPARLGDAVDEYLRPIARGRSPRAAAEEARERLRRFTLAGDPRHTLDVLPRLREASPPALVLWGEQDRFLPVDLGRRLARELHAPFEAVPGCGHFLPEERPDVLVERILSFCGPQGESISGD